MSGNLEIQDLHFSYGEISILRGINLTLGAGEICAVIGQTGSGKTTLLKCLLLLERPLQGCFRLDDMRIDCAHNNSTLPMGYAQQLRRKLGYVPQSNLLLPHLTTLKNVTLPLTEAHGHSQRAANGMAKEALSNMGISELARRRPWQLSGGQQQRAALARALAPAPALLLLDEPTAALDVATSRLVGAAVRADVMKRESSAIIVTHNLGFAKKVCDRVMLLSAGRVQWDVPSAELDIEQTVMDLT